MSTILKALDRLEREKQEPMARTLKQQVVAPGAPAAAGAGSLRNPVALASLAVGLGLGLGGLGLYLAAARPAPPAAAVVAEAPPAPVAAAQPVAPPPEPAPAPQAAAQVAALPGPEAGWRIETDPEEADQADGVARHRALMAMRAAGHEPVLDQEVAVAASDAEEDLAPAEDMGDMGLGSAPEARPDAEPVAVVPPPPVEERAVPVQVPAVKPSESARPAAPKRAAAAKPGPAPRSSAGSAAGDAAPETARAPETAPVRSRVEADPELSVVSTTWHPSGERRHALIRLDSGETREVREGDSVAGLSVRRIEPSRVVLSNGAVDIVRRVGSAR